MRPPKTATPKASDRELAEMRERADLYGLALTGKCQWCGRPVWQDMSTAEKAGSTCRRRHKPKEAA